MEDFGQFLCVPHVVFFYPVTASERVEYIQCQSDTVCLWLFRDCSRCYFIPGTW